MLDWCLLGLGRLASLSVQRKGIATAVCMLASLIDAPVSAQGTSNAAMVFFWAEDIERPGPSSWKPLGSGFLVSDQGVILTARHVVTSVVTGQRVVASISDKSMFPVPIDETDILCAMANRDVCAVRVPPGSVPNSVDKVFNLECGPLPVRTQLRAMGFTGGADRFGGVIEPGGEVVGSAMRGGLIPTDLDLVPTMSGGPVLNDRGNVVALAKGADRTSPNLTFVIPIIGIKPVLESLNVECEFVESNLADRTQLEVELSKLFEIAEEVDFSISHQELRVIPALNHYANFPSRGSWSEVVHSVSIVHQRLERAIELEVEFAASLDSGSSMEQVANLLRAVSFAEQNLENLDNRRYNSNNKADLIRGIAQGHIGRSTTYRLLSGNPIEPREAFRHIDELRNIAQNLRRNLNAVILHYQSKIAGLSE